MFYNTKMKKKESAVLMTISWCRSIIWCYFDCL